MHGTTADGYEHLLELGPAEIGSGGAAVAAYVDDRLVLDGHWGESRPGVLWSATTLCVSMSTAKVVIATAVAALAERGELDVERAVSAYWPAFAADGKAEITVADVLRHRSGTAYPPHYRQVATQDDADLWEHSRELAALVADNPPSTPVGRIAYGVSTIGPIVDEIVTRATGSTLDEVVRSLIAQPLGLRLTRTPTEDELADTADLHLGSTMTAPQAAAAYAPGTLIGNALLLGQRPLADAVSSIWNTPTRRRTGNWSYAVHSDARSLARLAAALANGGEHDGSRIVGERTLIRHLAPSATAHDAVWDGPTTLGLGFSYGDPDDPTYQHTPASFGHHGIGGAVLLADPVRRIGFAFVPSRWERSPATDPRAARILDGLYDLLRAGAT